ncbi:MAG: hydroxyphenylacetyl-CoA thioesterase PaaI [Acidothermaceae bacterium]
MTESAARATEPDDLARACAQAMFDADTASRTVGMQIVDVGPGRATVRMAVSDQMLNGHGIGHGGYTFMLADSAFAFACNSYDVATVAAACDIVFLAPTRAGDVLEAAAAERHRGARRGIYDVTVTRVNAEPAEVVAQFRGISQSTKDPVLGRTTKGAQPAEKGAQRSEGEPTR